MSADILALYSEFTAALTEVQDPHVVADLQGLVPPSRSTRNTTNMNTF